MPCPFCGATPHRQLGKRYSCQLHGDPLQDHIIRCPHLCAQRTASSKEAAIAAWNQRTTPAEVAALKREVERLRGALERLIVPFSKWHSKDDGALAFARAALAHKEPGDEG